MGGYQDLHRQNKHNLNSLSKPSSLGAAREASVLFSVEPIYCLNCLDAKHIVIGLVGGVAHFHILSHDRDAALYRGPQGHGLRPALDVGILRNINAVHLLLLGHGPGKGGYVGHGVIGARQVFRITPRRRSITPYSCLHTL